MEMVGSKECSQGSLLEKIITTTGAADLEFMD